MCSPQGSLMLPKEGNNILKESNLKIIPASDLSDAAEKIVKEIN